VCIVNMQTTIYDYLADLRIFSKTDNLCRFLMEELGLSVSDFDVSSFFMSQ